MNITDGNLSPLILLLFDFKSALFFKEELYLLETMGDITCYRYFKS